MQSYLTTSKAGNQLEKPVRSLADQGEKGIQGWRHQCKEAHWTLLPVFTGEATGETFTPTFIVYNSEGLGQFELSTEEALGWMDKLDVVHLDQAFTGQFQTWNWRTAGQQVASVTPVHIKDPKGTGTTEKQIWFPFLQSNNGSNHCAQTTTACCRVCTASVKGNPTKTTTLPPSWCQLTYPSEFGDWAVGSTEYLGWTPASIMEGIKQDYLQKNF